MTMLTAEPANPLRLWTHRAPEGTARAPTKCSRSSSRSLEARAGARSRDQVRYLRVRGKAALRNIDRLRPTILTTSITSPTWRAAGEGGRRCVALKDDASHETLGINTRAELARSMPACAPPKARRTDGAGVTIYHPETCVIDATWRSAPTRSSSRSFSCSAERASAPIAAFGRIPSSSTPKSAMAWGPAGLHD